MPPRGGNSCTFLLRVVGSVTTSNGNTYVLPRNILFHNGTRNRVHGGVIGTNCVGKLVKLPRGLFCNAKVPTYVVVLSGRRTSSHGKVFVVSTGSNFMGSKGVGHLHRRSVRHVISA